MKTWRFVISLSLIGLFTVFVSPASAHANLIRSDPSANAFLTEAPAEIRLWFSEPLQSQFSHIRLLDNTGAELNLPDTRVDDLDLHQMVISTGDLADGLYTVSWRAVSATDGHATEGSFSFGINIAVNVGVEALVEAPIPPLMVFVNALHLLTASLTVGGLAFALFVLLADDLRQTRYRRLLHLLYFAWGGWGLSLLAVLVMQTSKNTNLPFLESLFSPALIETLTATRFGQIWLLRLVFWVGLGGCLWWGAQRRGVQWLALACGAAILTGQSYFGHASGVQDTWTAVAANALHLFLTALWMGGLFAFLLVLIPLPGGEQAASNTGVLVGKFSNYARGTVIGLMLTGAYAAWLYVGSLEALVETFYGRTLAIKLLLLLPLLAIAAINLIWTARKLKAGDFRWVGRLRGLVGAESALLIAVLVAAAALTSGSPARPTQALNAVYKAAAEVEPYFGMETVNGQMIHLEIVPGVVGQNEFIVTLFDETGARVTDASLIRLRLENRDQDLGRSEIRPELAPNGTFRVTAANLSLPGDWRIRLNIQRPGQFDVVTDFDVNVMLPPAPPAVDVQAIPPAERIAAAGFLGVLLVTTGGFMLASERKTNHAGARIVSLALLSAGLIAIVSASILLVGSRWPSIS